MVFFEYFAMKMKARFIFLFKLNFVILEIFEIYLVKFIYFLHYTFKVKSKFLYFCCKVNYSILYFFQKVNFVILCSLHIPDQTNIQNQVMGIGYHFVCYIKSRAVAYIILTFIDDLRSVLYGTISVILLSKYCVPLFFNMFVPIRS